MSEHSPIAGKTPQQAYRSAGAVARQAERDSVSNAEQLEALDARPGNSAKERARLAADE